MKQKLLYTFLFLYTVLAANAQTDISLYEQFNGRYDFTFAGNTLNVTQNGVLSNGTCTILTSSSAQLNLNTNDEILKAYLYWAGSGTGDFDIQLNAQDITAQRTFNIQRQTAENINGQTMMVNRFYFGAFADVTALVQAQGAGSYTVSELDLTDLINENGQTPTQNLYCRNGTNFGGWAILVLYKNDNLPLNQINLYDGFEFVPNNIDIDLPSLNVIDNNGAKIGFLAWEGDESIAINEKLTINNIVLSNALNPPTNAFNCTNSITGSVNLHNMDIDIYNIENMIQVGDESANIKLQSGQDLVIVNAIITKLNSQLPDATISAENIATSCDSRELTIDYKVANTNSTDILPAPTPIAFYVNNTLVATAQTTAPIPIDGIEEGTITVTVPAGMGPEYELLLVVDDTGNGSGIVQETEENNNTYTINDSLWVSPVPVNPADITVCETFNNSGVGIFNFSAYEEQLKGNPDDTVTFYISQEKAEEGLDNITNTANYTSVSATQAIYVRVEDVHSCYGFTSFNLIAVDCLFPDATVQVNNISQECNSRIIDVAYSVNNFNSDDILPSGTPVSIYVDGVFFDYTETLLDIPVDGSEEGVITLEIPASLPLDFELTFVADDIGDGTGIVKESDETNNAFTVTVNLWIKPVLMQPENIISCNEGFGLGTFDFSGYEDSLKNESTDVVSFYKTLEDALSGAGGILDISSYKSEANPQEIFVRLEDENGCFTTGSFLLRTRKCPPETFNYVTPNDDGYNDTFFVKGLRNVFLNFKMSIYNRWGNLVWEGNHSKEDWDGIASVSKVGPGNNAVPSGTYYFVLELNDPEYPEPIVGWVHVAK
ncbi:gliding motility-associated C-terminal domain-containing protein [Flavobacterium sp. MK4S-17]|uniref:T9SS type B sorting domain-containing protein n=1 Tax=Flavobacterium sp. MK4S-17 TaxID=2543737 RepID=UPI00135A4B2B|nr:gliding motility-associated C-terminal domain-containing protein [Flavobacterium sp. MK4S-17]